MLYKEQVEKYRDSIKENKMRNDVDANLKSVKYAYVVFRSMEGMQKVLDAYNFSKSYRISAVWCGCFCKKRK